MPDLHVENLTKEYPTPGEPLRVLRGVDLQLNAGENLAILGPSGSGKSTLLHILGTLESPTGGSVLLEGQNPFALSERALARFRNRYVGFIFQEHHLLPQLNVLENVLVPALAEGAAGQDHVARARALVERVGLADRIEHRPAELSGGERQRVAVARALLNQPRLLLADEPTGSLDRTNAEAVGELLLKLQRSEQMMLVAVTHSQNLADRFDRSMGIDDGRLISLAHA